MIEINTNLFIGNIDDCRAAHDMAIVHACKTPCHQLAVGYTKSLPQNHPNYLIKETQNNLYLNLVDMDKILPQFTDEPIKKSLTFIKTKLNEDKKVLIHCNLGQSRSCAIGLIYLAIEGIITKESYQKALNEFREFYPNIALGIGFHNYLQNTWERIINNYSDPKT